MWFTVCFLVNYMFRQQGQFELLEWRFALIVLFLGYCAATVVLLEVKMITYHKGNILHDQADAIINTVNTVGYTKKPVTISHW